MPKEQIKPLLEIDFLDDNREPVFSYKCDIHHIRSVIRSGHTPVGRDLRLERVSERIIKGDNIENADTVEEAIHSAKSFMIHNYLSLKDDRSINEYDAMWKRVGDGEVNWKIKKFHFDRTTSMRDVMFEDYCMPFTESRFKYLGSEKEFEVIRSTIHVGELDGYEHLETLEVEWGSYESVGRVIDRAREKYQQGN
jgi:hypothetical protein